MTADEVYSKLASGLKHADWPSLPGPLRTDAVKRALHGAGELLAPGACTPYYTGCPNSMEFMLDFCCMDRHSHDMILAAEAALTESTVGKVVDDDFQKLVYVKAPLKVLLFQKDPEAVLAKALEFLRLYPRHLTGDTYIFVHIDGSGKTSGWGLTIGRDGKLPEAAKPRSLSS